MVSLELLRNSVETYLSEPCVIAHVEHVPERSTLALGPEAIQVEATALSIDIRQFSSMTNALGRKVVVKMLKAFFDGSVRLVVDAGGVVADFNGDGMITLFAGRDRAERAVYAAGQIHWFLNEMLRPYFADYFREDQALVAHIAEFDAGCGLDDGLVLVGRVGVNDFSDIAWVGRCVNTSAKLCKNARSPQALIATHEVYERLDGSQISAGIQWSSAGLTEIGGIPRTVLTTNYQCPPSQFSNLQLS